MIAVQRCEAHRVRHRMELYNQQMTVEDHSAPVCPLVVVVVVAVVVVLVLLLLLLEREA